ncbi:D-alanyl-D-alanine carboxypeptidase DacB [Collinsella intestinalis]|nr:D-alanyl-D-alanine carboxypeptidase DacB [Collinsella intestinalis]
MGESCVGLKEGDTLTLEQALTGLMVMSGNDVATAIATHVGGKIDPASADPYGTFIKAMNDRAAQLGCTDTLFENPHGLDFGAWVGNLHSTAHDVTRIWAEAWRNEAFRSFACSDATEMHVISADGSARSLPLTVRNKILGRDGNLGGKTGSTYEAGECFVCTFSREPEGEVYIALFGSKGDDGRFNDTLTLANWYYGHFANLPFATSPKQVGGVPLAAEAACVDWSDKLMDLTFADANAAARAFTLGGPIEQKVEVDELRGKHAAGTAAGSVTYTQNGETIGSVELTTTNELEPPNLLEWLAVQLDRLVRLFEGKPPTAEERIYATMPDPLSIDGWNA